MTAYDVSTHSSGSAAPFGSDISRVVSSAENSAVHPRQQRQRPDSAGMREVWYADMGECGGSDEEGMTVQQGLQLGHIIMLLVCLVIWFGVRFKSPPVFTLSHLSHF